jgi:hypothetical protein
MAAEDREPLADLNARSRRNDAGAARRKAIQNTIHRKKALGSAKAEAGAKMLVNV